MRLNLFLGALLIAAMPVTQAAERPNILVVMADNYGWGEPGVYGGGDLRGAATPRIDQLAAEGLRLQNFNVETQCVPSRSAFMTGRHPIRSGTTKVVFGAPYGLVGWERTIPEILADEGYASALYGKWHLGDSPGRYPTDQGFDEWYGIPNTSDEAEYSSQFQYDPTVGSHPAILQARKGQTPEKVKDYNLQTRRTIDGELVEHSIDFMRRSVKAEQPFFLFVALTQPHLPTLPHPDFAGKTGNGDYSDVLAEIDHRVGQLVDALDQLKIADDTLVIFTSDNGPEETAPWQGSAGPWRGHYFTILEGSLRVPFIARWPGKVPAGQVSNEVLHMVDLLPTLVHAGGGQVPSDRKIDGVDQLAFFTGQTNKSAREGFPVFNGDDLYGYKWRNWKLHLIELNSMFGKPHKLNVPQLFQLIHDPKEEYDVVGQNTWVLPVVMKQIVAFNRSLAEEPPIRFGTPEPYMPAVPAPAPAPAAR